MTLKDLKHMKSCLLEQNQTPPFRFVTADRRVVIDDPDIVVEIDLDCAPGSAYLIGHQQKWIDA